MRLYELLEQVSNILTPRTHSLYEYMLHTFDDDGGFLRTRYCYWEKTLQDFEIEDLKKILICFKNDFKEGETYFENEDTSGKITKVKMQLFYCEYSDDDIRWSYELNFSFPYEINLEEKTFKKLQLLSY